MLSLYDYTIDEKFLTTQLEYLDVLSVLLAAVPRSAHPILDFSDPIQF